MVRRLAGTAAILLLSAACGDDPDSHTTPEPFGSIRGNFTDVETGEPLAGVEVFLIPSIGEQPLTAAVMTDSAGAFRFDGLEPAPYGLFVHDAHRFLQRLERDRQVIEVEAGGVADGDLSFWVTDPASGAWRVQGRVLDRRTGNPVPRAYVAGMFAPAMDRDVLIGTDSNPGIDVTDEDGRFDVRVGTVVRDPGVESGLDPVTAMAVDYRPTTIGEGGTEGDPAHLPFPETGSPLEVTIQLSHVADFPSAPRGTVTGRATFLGAPVANLEIGVGIDGLSLLETPRRAALSVPFPNAVPTTDAQGEFLMAFPAGHYAFHPGIYATATHAADPFMVDVVAGETVGPIEVRTWRVVAPLSPANGTEGVPPSPTLTWRDFPASAGWTDGAWRVAYAVGRNRWTAIECGGDTTCAVPPSHSLPAGARVRWRAQFWALPTGELEPQKLADFAAPAWFVVQEPF